MTKVENGGLGKASDYNLTTIEKFVDVIRNMAIDAADEVLEISLDTDVLAYFTIKDNKPVATVLLPIGNDGYPRWTFDVKQMVSDFIDECKEEMDTDAPALRVLLSDLEEMKDLVTAALNANSTEMT